MTTTEGHTMIENLTTATPVEIDTRIAELHAEINVRTAAIRRATMQVLNRSGLRVRHSATWETRRTTYTVSGTFEDGVAILTAYRATFDAWIAAGYPSDNRPADPAGASGYGSPMDTEQIDKLVAERDAALARRFELWAESNELQSEYARRPWSRYYLVVSSAGHIHSSTGCQTCRFTTVFGWMPERSGQSEADAIASLGKHADALCSVCYPTAPVVSKRTNVTKATAGKMATALVAREGDEDLTTDH